MKRVYEPSFSFVGDSLQKISLSRRKSPLGKAYSLHFLTGLRGLEIHITKLASSWSNNLNSQSAARSPEGVQPRARVRRRGLTLYQTRYLSWRCRRTSRKPRSRRGELEKGDSHAFLFETIVSLTYPQKRIAFTKTTANL